MLYLMRAHLEDITLNIFNETRKYTQPCLAGKSNNTLPSAARKPLPNAYLDIIIRVNVFCSRAQTINPLHKITKH